MSEPYIQKHWLDSLPSDKPLLLIYSDEPPPLNEQRIIAASDSITRIGEVNFAKLELSAFPDERQKIRADFLANKDSLLQRDQWYLSSDTNPVHFDGFGDGPFELGEKVRYEHKDKAVLFNEVLPAKQGEIDMKVSFWLKVDIESEYLPAVIMEQYDKDLMVNQVPVECKFTKDVYRDWVRVEMDFFLQKPTNRIYMYTFTPAEHFRVDNILFQPKGTDVYAWDGERLFLNNYLID